MASRRTCVSNDHFLLISYTGSLGDCRKKSFSLSPHLGGTSVVPIVHRWPLSLTTVLDTLLNCTRRSFYSASVGIKKLGRQMFFLCARRATLSVLDPSGEPVIGTPSILLKKLFTREKILWISWLCNVSGPMVRHKCHGMTTATHPSPVKSSFSL